MTRAGNKKENELQHGMVLQNEWPDATTTDVIERELYDEGS